MNEHNQQETPSSNDPRYHSINGRMYRVIVLLVFIAALLGTFQASNYYIRMLSRSFEQTGMHICVSSANILYDPQLEKMVNLELSEEYAKVREQAIASKDETILSRFFDDHGLGGFVSKALEQLSVIEENFEIDDLYVVACQEDACIYVIGTYGNILDQGKTVSYKPDRSELLRREPFSLGYSPFSSGSKLDYLHDKDASYVALAPIGDGEGMDNSYWLASETKVRPYVQEIESFLLKMLGFLIIISSGCAIIGVMILRCQLTSPILKLKKAMENFEDHNTAEHAALPVDPGLNRRDELGDLSNSLYSLQKNVYDTQHDLKKLSEEKGRFNAELSIATAIQQGVLPSVFPAHENCEIYAVMKPARQVGGDFYDFFMIGDDQLALVIGDVSDKGIPASLFMMTSKALIKSQAQSGCSPAKVLEIVNEQLCDNNPADMFVTVWIGILNLVTGSMTAANGGHEYPFIAFGDKPFEVFKDPHSLALGMMRGVKYKDYEIQFEPGDRLLVYSDGATDAIDAKEQPYGLENLLETVRRKSASHNPKDLVAGIQNELEDYSRETYQFDDITLLSVTFLQKRSSES